MNPLAPASGNAVALFDPQATRRTIAQADAVVAYAKEVRDWPLLERAVDEKIEQQQEFVRWWKDAVRDQGHQPNNADRHYLPVTEAEILTGIAQYQVSRWRKHLQDVERYRERLCGVAWAAASMGDKSLADFNNHRGVGSGENEWYTPAQYIELARLTMGGIDLDPASSEQANRTIGAAQFFGIDDDGLSREWHGRVWLNPPYAQPAIDQFIAKLVTEVLAGHVEQAIALTHNYTDTQWFHRAASAAHAIAFTRGRIAFESPAGEKAAPTQGQAFFYFGRFRDTFIEVFANVGFVVVLA